MTDSTPEQRAAVVARLGLSQPLNERTAPFRGAPIQLSRRPGPRPGTPNPYNNVGPARVSGQLPVTKGSILARLRGR